MKYALFLVPLLVLGTVFSPTPAAALSCLETSMYLDTMVGADDVVIFTGTVTDTIDTAEYTAETLTVTAAAQGYVGNNVMVYHEKHPDWGYLCNTGPAQTGVTSTYITTRNSAEQYQVTMRLDADSELAQDLAAQLADADITGEVFEVTTTDRKNQIMTTILDLFQQIKVLLKEYEYWTLLQ